MTKKDKIWDGTDLMDPSASFFLQPRSICTRKVYTNRMYAREAYFSNSKEY